MTKININKQKYKTAIIILNWNGMKDTEACFRSIQQYCMGEDFLVVLVDNNSAESIDPLVDAKWEIPLLIIKNADNKGFAGGNNIGIETSLAYKPDYILLLNNDTVIIDNLLRKMVAVMDVNVTIGVSGAINYYFSKPSEIWYAGIRVSKLTGRASSVNAETSDQLIDVDYVPGSSLMFRTSLIPDIGLLDEKFFAYCEEFDLCLRVKKAGHRVIYIPKTKILHKVGSSTSTPAKEYLRLRNKLYLFHKHRKDYSYYNIFAIEILKSFIKAGLKMIGTGKTVYYTALYYAIKDYRNNYMGKGSFEKFLQPKSR